MAVVVASIFPCAISPAMAVTRHKTVAKTYAQQFPAGVKTNLNIVVSCPRGMYATGGGYEKDGTGNLLVFQNACSQPEGER